MKPIICNSQIVQNILADRQTQDKRIINPQPTIDYLENLHYNGFNFGQIDSKPHFANLTKCKHPYKVGEVLYVRESIIFHKKHDNIKPSFLKNSINFPDIAYAADINKNEKLSWMGKTRPSIHMPKKYARIFLEVIETRCERIQDISEKDEIQEGVRGKYEGLSHYPPCQPNTGYIDNFIKVWESIYGKGVWERNDFVWVTKFKRKVIKT